MFVTDNACSASKRVFREENLVVSEEAEKQPMTESSRSEEQPPIATFDEWTKEKLKQEGHRKNHLQVCAHFVLFYCVLNSS